MKFSGELGAISAGGRFEVLSRLGEGGFGVVYEVLDHKLDERVALKTLQRVNADSLYRFKKEFRLLADIASRNLVTLHELHADGDTWFFTMELIDGVDFAAAIHDDPDDRELRWILGELASGVGALHDAGILHRDLKPSNVLVVPGERVVLLDFGLVTEASAERSTEAVMGTAAYMSPEQARAEKVGEAADWYAVGVMLYEALTGELPYPGSMLQALLAKQTNDPPPPWEIDPDAPLDLGQLAMQLLCRDPARRAGREALLEAIKSGSTVSGHVEQAASPHHPAALSTGSAPLGESVFVGRQRELDLLADAFGAAATSNEPVVVQIHGRSGMGKSTLLGRFLSDVANDKRAVVLSGRCFEQESVPFKALDGVIDTLCGYLRGLDEATVKAVLPRNVRALARLFPVLDRVKAIQQAPDRTTNERDPRELRDRGVRALGELLGRIGDQGPLVLAIDDLQWGDLDSVRLLGQLLQGPDRPAMLLLLCQRTEDREQSACLRELEHVLEPSRVVEVGALSDEHARDLVSCLLGQRSTPELVAAVAGDAGGSPFFVSALVSWLAAGGKLELAAGGLSLEQVISDRVSALPDDARCLLEIIAVAGEPIAVNLATAASGAPLAALAQLRNKTLVRRCAGQDEPVECYHDRIRETVVSSLAPADLQRCHDLLAGALSDSDRSDPERLANHLLAAGKPGEAASYAEQAARAAAEKLAFGRAAQLYRVALDVEQSDETRARSLRIRLADVLARSGRGSEAADAYLTAAEGLELSSAMPLLIRGAKQLLTCARFQQGRDVLCSVLTDLGLEMAPTASAAMASIQNNCARLQDLGFVERRASEIPSRELLRADALWAASAGLASTHVIHGFDFITRFAILALQIGEPVRVIAALRGLAYALGYLGHWDHTTYALEQVEKLADRSGDINAVARVRLTAGQVAVASGRATEAVALCEEALELFDQCTGVGQDRAFAESHVLWALETQGRVEQLRERSPQVRRNAETRNDMFSWLACIFGDCLVHLCDDDTAAAWQRLARAEVMLGRDWILQHDFVFLTRSTVSVYTDEGATTWAGIRELWPRVEASGILLLPLLASLWHWTRGKAAIVAASALRDASTVGAALDDVASCAKALEANVHPFSEPYAKTLRAELAFIRGEPKAAAAGYLAAERGFKSLDMQLRADAARRRRGTIIGAEEGRALVESADTSMRKKGVVRPDRLAAINCPGFLTDA